ncbi:hypothetical protein KAU15_02330, partial [candidate division WOR-3 bacterium]|nr:hypothetical protein [candidate division WOR-3 bacterium]
MDLFSYNFQTNTGMMEPGDTIKYDFEIPLIDYYNSSNNNKITLELNGSTITKEINCTVIPAKLLSRIICDDTINSGVVIDAKIINQGGLPTNFTSKLRIIDSYGETLDVDSITSNVEVFDSTEISLSLPEFINDDTYQISLITEYNDKTIFSSKTVKINGIMIAGNVYSENDYYFTDAGKIGYIDLSSNPEIDTLLINYKITGFGEDKQINISGISTLKNGQFDNTYLSPNYNGIGIAPRFLLDEEFEKRNFMWVVKMDIDNQGNIYITDGYSDRVFVMDNNGNYLRYINTGMYWLWDIVVDDDFIYIDNGNQIKCLTKEGDTKWTINSGAYLLDISGDTVFINEYGCIGLLDRYTGELIDVWTYPDVNRICYGFYDEYYNALIVLTSDKELIKINNNGEIIERNPLNIDISVWDCEGFYSMNDGVFGVLYRPWSGDENEIFNYTIDRYGTVTQTDEIDEYVHAEWGAYIFS